MTSLFPLSQQQLLERCDPPLFPQDAVLIEAVCLHRHAQVEEEVGWGGLHSGNFCWHSCHLYSSSTCQGLDVFHVKISKCAFWGGSTLDFRECGGKIWACRLWLRFAPWVATLAHIRYTAGLRVPKHTGLDRRQKMGFSIGSGAKVVLCSVCWVCSVAAPLQSVSWPSFWMPATQSIVRSSQGLFSECNLKSACVRSGISFHTRRRNGLTHPAEFSHQVRFQSPWDCVKLKFQTEHRPEEASVLKKLPYIAKKKFIHSLTVVFQSIWVQCERF